MKKIIIITALLLGSIVSPIITSANANPSQDVQKVINFCARKSQNNMQYRVCLNQGARLIQQKYSNSTFYNNRNSINNNPYTTFNGSGQINRNGSWSHYDRDYGSVGGDGNGCYYAFGWSNC